MLLTVIVVANNHCLLDFFRGGLVLCAPDLVPYGLLIVYVSMIKIVVKFNLTKIQIMP